MPDEKKRSNPAEGFGTALPDASGQSKTGAILWGLRRVNGKRRIQ
jgi:hypothetical protein